MEASSGKFVSVNQMLTEMTPSYPVYCLRPDLIAKSADQFIQDFPGKTMFAVKCNPHPTVLKMLYKAGISHFDVASLQEISQISELFPDAALYYMHPVKPQAHIDSAHDVYHVRLTCPLKTVPVIKLENNLNWAHKEVTHAKKTLQTRRNHQAFAIS